MVRQNTIQPTLPPVAQALDALGAPYRLHVHSQIPASLEQAAAERGQRVEQVVRSLLFRLHGAQYVLVLVAGTSHVSWPALRRHLQRSRISQATPEEVERVTGYAVGTVGPFGLRRAVRIIVDRSLLAVSEVSFGSGRPGTAVLMQRDDFLAALGAIEIAPLTECAASASVAQPYGGREVAG